MANKNPRQKARDLHEKYAKQFAGKLKEKDAMISRLIQERDEARTAHEEALELLRTKSETIDRLNAEIERLAKLANMTEDDLIAFRKDMINREKAGAALSTLLGIGGVISASGTGYMP